ncbi:hypothetical protein [Glutamicibacter creatinolyticus]|uniref:hypothetical protein n=1 Tax=Glutamicibacter creatinolyticus TaxID=162496 RepID=UPI003217E419
MFEMLCAIAEMAGGYYEIAADGTLKAWDLLGMLAGCNTLGGSELQQCAATALGVN